MLITLKAALTKRIQLTHDVLLLTFTPLPGEQKLTFKSGQYAILHVPKDGATHRRLYSIASPAAKNDSFELLIELVPNGVGSEYLNALKENDISVFQGPAGIFTLRESSRHILFLATGTGYAPMRSMFYELISQKQFESRTINLLWGLPHYEDVYLAQELLDWANLHSNINIKICLSRETDLNKVDPTFTKLFTLGRITVEWQKMLEAATDKSAFLNSFDYYVCGGRGMVEDMKNILLSQGVDKQLMHFEKF